MDTYARTVTSAADQPERTGGSDGGPRVVVGVDGSPGARAALAWAVRAPATVDEVRRHLSVSGLPGAADLDVQVLVVRSRPGASAEPATRAAPAAAR